MNEQKPIIVVIDDQPAILHTVALALRELYQVRPFPSGQIALKYLEKQPADLILLDIDMPEMDGFAVAAAVRASEQHADTPIIFLTGNSVEEHMDKAMQCGGNDFIVKPAERDTLLAKVAEYLP